MCHRGGGFPLICPRSGTRLGCCRTGRSNIFHNLHWSCWAGLFGLPLSPCRSTAPFRRVISKLGWVYLFDVAVGEEYYSVPIAEVLFSDTRVEDHLLAPIRVHVRHFLLHRVPVRVYFCSGPRHQFEVLSIIWVILTSEQIVNHFVRHHFDAKWNLAEIRQLHAGVVLDYLLTILVFRNSFVLFSLLLLVPGSKFIISFECFPVGDILIVLVLLVGLCDWWMNWFVLMWVGLL